MCNQPKVSLVKLFLDLPVTSATAASAVSTVVDWEEVEEDVDSESDGNSGSNDNKKTKNQMTLEKYRAWQQQAKQYKERWQNAKDNLSKQARKLQRHQLEVEDLESQLKQAAEDLENEHHVVERQQRLLECLRLEKVQAQRACEALQRQVDLAQEQTVQAQARLTDVQKSYDVALANASAQSLHEVQHILEAYPKLQQENQRLKAMIQKMTHQSSSTGSHRHGPHKNHLSSQSRGSGGRDGGSSTSSHSRSSSGSDKARRHKELLTNLGNPDDFQWNKKPTLPKRSITKQPSHTIHSVAAVVPPPLAAAAAASKATVLGKRKMPSSGDAIMDLLLDPQPNSQRRSMSLLGWKTKTVSSSSQAPPRSSKDQDGHNRPLLTKKTKASILHHASIATHPTVNNKSRPR
jgi:hypothetical protein